MDDHDDGEITRISGPEEVELLLEWALGEGWNPGLDDAVPFYRADPDGFFLRNVAGVPVAGVAVANHSDDVAVLGLYLCHPGWRGLGHGYAVWRAGLVHAGKRSVILDGVVAQQANYAREGFVPVGRTIRHEGRIADLPAAAARAEEAAGQVRLLAPADVEPLLALDARVEGYPRHAHMRAWFEPTDTRWTAVIGPEGAPRAWATMRACGVGVKIGPLAAATEAEALALIGTLARDRPCQIDVPEESEAFSALLRSLDFAPVFETARMVRGTAPRTVRPAFSAVTTIELG